MLNRAPSLTLAIAAAFAATAALLPVACTSSSDSKGQPSGSGGGADTTFSPDGGAGSSAGQCATPEEGCACQAEGSTASCGKKLYQEGSYIYCAHGTLTCEAGAWGACETGEATDVFHRSSEPAAHLEGLGASQTCVNNPCDPYCNQFADNPTGITPGPDAGLVNDGGLALTPVLGNPTSTCTGLTETPQTMTVTVTSIASNGAITTTSSPSPSQFTAQFTPAGCYQGNAPAVWTLNKPGIATISSTGLFSLVSPIPGPIQIYAYAGNFNTTANPGVVNVKVDVSDSSGAPAGYSASSFNAASSTADSITVLYPYNGTVLPLGLPAPLIQWDNKGVAANAIQVTLRYPADGSLFKWEGVYPESLANPTPSLPAKPRAVIPQAVWSAFEQAAKGQDATFAIQRIVGGVLRVENPPVTLHFATGQLKGTIYYNTYGTNLASNYCCTATGANFGGATLAIKPNAAQPVLVAGDNSNCRVCHSVAAGGSKLITLRNDYVPVSYALSNLAQTVLSPNDGRFGWPAISPDGTYMFSNSGPLAGGTTSVKSGIYPISGGSTPWVSTNINAFTPSFSPDSNHIAFNFYGGTSGSLTGDAKTLAAVDYNPSTKAMSAAYKLATPGSGGVGAGNIYYPAYLPNNNQVIYELETVFNQRDVGGTRSQCDQGGNVPCQNEGTHGELWWVDVASKTSARLNALNGRNSAGTSYLPTHPTYTTNPAADPEFNYEPTINPQETGGYAWVVFTSRRAYGNVATVNPFWSDPRFQDISKQPTTKKLWAAAIKTGGTPGTDISYPAFYVPGQELLAGNSRGYWVLDACKPAGSPSAANLCDTDLDCCPAAAGQPPVTCALDPGSQTVRHCAQAAAAQCIAQGGACSIDSQCCNFPNALCAQGVCKPPPPLTSYYEAPFVRDYQATCDSGKVPVWRMFGILASTPGTAPNGSYINLSVQTADTSAGLDTAQSVALGTLSGPGNDTTWNYYDVAPKLASSSPAQQSRAFLRVTMMLEPSTDHSFTPVLLNWNQMYDCIDSE